MWKTIVDFEYEINEDGQVRNSKTAYLLNPGKDKDGYLQIGLRKPGNRKKYWFKIHKLVALHFLEIEDKHVDHIDRNKLNNHFTNLRWVTPQENNDNRKQTCWTTNLLKELYITRYPNGFMVRINRHDLKHRSWHRCLETAMIKRDALVESMLKKNVA